jgi:ATP-dependent Zn protease
MTQTVVPINALPVELNPDEAVEIAYRADLDWIEHKLRLGMSVLIDCDKQLTLYLYRNLRRRLRTEPALRCRLIAGQSAVNGEGPQSLMQAILAELREQVYGGEQDQILVLPHLDVLTTTTRSGLNAEAREAIAMVFENPNLVLLGFRDPLFEIPRVLENVFAVRREIVGMPRDALPQLVIQREARKLGEDSFNPYTLYKYVSGLNAVRFRQIMSHLHDRVDFSPNNPNSADEIYREIRQMTVLSDLDLPSVQLRDDIGGYDKVKTQIEEEILTLLQFKNQSTDADEVRRIEEIIPKGMIFFGPPGTGKTFFAKAIATSLNATVSIISGPELKSKWVGESLPWDEPVLVCVNGRVQHMPIGHLVEHHQRDEVYAWTASDRGQAQWAPVSAFFQHKGPDYIDVITTETGREVRVTGGHSLFVQRDGLLADVIADDIIPGETRVAVPLRLHTPETLHHIDLLQRLAHRDDVYVQGYEPTLALASPDDTLALRDGATTTVKELLQKKTPPPLPLASFAALCAARALEPHHDGLELYSWHRNKALPARLPLTEDLGLFLGIWAAEGDLSTSNGVRVTIHERELPFIQPLCERLFGHVTVSPRAGTRGVTLIMSHTLLAHTLTDALGLQTGSHNKRAPADLLLAPRPVIAAFLRGYFSGDGGFNGKSIEATTVSRGLAHDVATLLQVFGIAARLRQRVEHSGSTSHRVRFTWSAFLRVFAQQIGFLIPEDNQRVLDYVDNLRLQRNLQTPEAHITNDVLWDKVVDKRREPYHRPFVYDISVPGTERFLAGYGNILVHNSEENIRRVFAQARRSAPSVIVFDELDSFATARGTYTGSGVEHSMVNQLLTEMDGFRKEELVFVVGTTNFSDSLDPALLRPGRFELLIEIPYPDRDDRRSVLEIYRRKFGLPLTDEQITALVDKTGGYVDEMRGVRFSGDHLYAICRALKREQLRAGKDFSITEDTLNKAISSRRKKKTTLSAAEERTIAIHEAGHAICAHMLPHVSAVEKITIATGDSDTLGYVMREVKENKYITTRNELFDDICMLLGGRVAEQMIIGDISVGAYDDLQKATALARSMVEELGMGKVIGLRTIAGREGLGRQATRENVSDAVAAEVDREITDILEEQRERCHHLLKTHFDLMETLIAILLDRKTIEKDEINQILGPPVRAHRAADDPAPTTQP